MNVFKSPNPNSIYLRYLMELKNKIIEPLTKIFNKSLRGGVVPDGFKLANVTYIYQQSTNLTTEKRH